MKSLTMLIWIQRSHYWPHLYFRILGSNAIFQRDEQTDPVDFPCCTVVHKCRCLVSEMTLTVLAEGGLSVWSVIRSLIHVAQLATPAWWGWLEPSWSSWRRVRLHSAGGRWEPGCPPASPVKRDLIGPLSVLTEVHKTYFFQAWAGFLASRGGWMWMWGVWAVRRAVSAVTC